MTEFVSKAQDALDLVRYKSWVIAAFPETDGPGAYLQVRFNAPDYSKDRPGRANPAVAQAGRKWRLSEHMTKSEIVQTALMAVLAAEEHEIREQFRYKGSAIFGPHFDVDRLHDMAGVDGASDVRPTPGAAAANKTWHTARQATVEASVLVARCEAVPAHRNWRETARLNAAATQHRWLFVDPGMS